MNDILKEQNTNEKVKKYNNYQKALYGGRDAPAVVGSSSSAATNDYNGYLSNQNATLRSQGAAAAYKYAIPQAYLESLGGAEKAFNTVLKPSANIAKEIVKGAGSEALEEAAQTPWEVYSRQFYGDKVKMLPNKKGLALGQTAAFSAVSAVVSVGCGIVRLPVTAFKTP